MPVLMLAGDGVLAALLRDGFAPKQLSADVVSTSAEVLRRAKKDYQLIIVDLDLVAPKGLHTIKLLRALGAQAPILMLVARRNAVDTVQGLDAGADDYLLKPFSAEQLLAHVRALLRRPRQLANKLAIADLEIDSVRRRVKRAGKLISLTPKEYALLECLVRNAGRPVTRSMLLQDLGGCGLDEPTNIIDVYVSHLRSKVDRGFKKKLIRTVRGVGYLLTDGKPDRDEAA